MATNTCKTCHFWAHQIAEIGPDAGKMSESGTCRRYAPNSASVWVYRERDRTRARLLSSG